MNKFLLFDIDYTLSTFDSEAGMAELQKYLRNHFDEGFTQKICSFISRGFSAFHAKAQGRDSQDIQKFEAFIKEAAKDIEGIQDFADIHWSRELWVYAASGGSLSPRSCVEAARHFWNGIKITAKPYDDTLNFFNLARSHNQDLGLINMWRVVFVTSSDARLEASRDNLKFLYSPEQSKGKKFLRIKDVLPPLKSPTFIGDPIGKPNIKFWGEVLEEIGYNSKEDLAIMTGDSYHVDIQGISQFSIVPVLIDRSGSTKPEDVPEAKHIIQGLPELSQIMASEEQIKSGER